MAQELRFTRAEYRDMGERLAAQIEASGATRARFAAKMGVTEPHLSGMCRHGKGSMAAWLKASHLLGVSLDWLVTGEYPASSWVAGKRHAVGGSR